jgi:hypothetical protein
MNANEWKDLLTPDEIRAAEKLINRALQPRVLPVYSPGERFALAILAANLSLLQRARGKKSKGAAKKAAEYRRQHVNLLLRHVVDKKYRKTAETANELGTVMKIIDWLDSMSIEASESQVRRDIHAALNSGPLPRD